MARESIEYRHLEVFTALMQSGSATGAGALLGTSQPAVSRLLGQMERLVGFSLFTRVRGRLVPTAVAEQLYAETECIFVGVRDIATLCDRLRRQEPPRIKIASLPVLTLSLLPAVALTWRRSDRPETLSIYSKPAGGVLGLVAFRQADLGLGIGLPRVPGVRSAPIAKARFYCAMTQDSPLAHLSTVKAEHLDGQPFIALSREEKSQDVIDAVMGAANSRPKEVVECRLVSAAAAMAVRGVGVTLVDAFSVEPFLHEALLLRPFEPAITIEYRLMWPEHSANDLHRTLLADIIRKESTALIRKVQRRVGAGAGEAAAS